MFSAVMTSQRARPQPISRGKQGGVDHRGDADPRPPACRICASCAAIRKSQAAATSRPPPRHQPGMRAITGAGNCADGFAEIAQPVDEGLGGVLVELRHLLDVGAADHALLALAGEDQRANAALPWRASRRPSRTPVGDGGAENIERAGVADRQPNYTPPRSRSTPQWGLSICMKSSRPLAFPLGRARESPVLLDQVPRQTARVVKACGQVCPVAHAGSVSIYDRRSSICLEWTADALFEGTASSRRMTRIVKKASVRLRERGAHGIGVADLMKDAGLTHGGFYAHFDSREALVIEAFRLCDGPLDRSLASVELGRRRRDQRLATIVDSYLSPQHRDNPGHGCAVPALGAEDRAREPQNAQGVCRQARSDDRDDVRAVSWRTEQIGAQTGDGGACHHDGHHRCWPAPPATGELSEELLERWPRGGGGGGGVPPLLIYDISPYITSLFSPFLFFSSSLFFLFFSSFPFL